MAQKLNFINSNSIMVINPKGKIRQLFCPFIVQVSTQIKFLHLGSNVYVEEVSIDNKYKIVFKIGEHWFPYNFFKINTLY